MSEALRRAVQLGAIAGLCLGGQAARASDPLTGETIAPPPNLNIFFYYNAFANAGAIGTPHDGTYGQNTRVNADIQALRYIRSFELGGMIAGVQMYDAYSNFIGPQEAGILAVGPFGPGRAKLDHTNGFSQPSFGAFIFPYADAQKGNYLVTGVWLSPPIGDYNKNATLNYSRHLWTFEGEAGGRATLLGTPTDQNVALELWGEIYGYGNNNDSAYVTPAVYANSMLGAGPLVPANSTPATLHEQPTGELRAYLPYQFYPPTRAVIAPGFYQSFGGKQVYTLDNGEKLDSGLRTNESQLRLMLVTYLSPHWQATLDGEYDIASHGGLLQRNIELRLIAAF
jgi:hypothetical protein